MQYYRKSKEAQEFSDMVNALCDPRTTHRKWGTIPGMVPAQDIWVFAEDPARDPDRLYMTIKNPCKAYRPMY